MTSRDCLLFCRLSVSSLDCAAAFKLHKIPPVSCWHSRITRILMMQRTSFISELICAFSILSLPAKEKNSYHVSMALLLDFFRSWNSHVGETFWVYLLTFQGDTVSLKTPWSSGFYSLSGPSSTVFLAS